MRIKGLDFLRGIAIIGVLFRHSEIKTVLKEPGGYGVDLFFVLSGFLVSGLLFNHYQKTGGTGIRKFLIRRGFKIYPAFYFFIGACILIDSFILNNHISSSSFFSEIFFLQSYIDPIRIHTWSLAVEEHFYILISVLFFIAVRFRWIENKKAVIIFLLSVIVLVFTLRLIHCVRLLDKPFEAFFATHLRIDGLFMGALLSYLCYFNPDVIKKIRGNRPLLYFLAILLVAPCFFLPPASLFMATIGFNIMHLGFAFFILLLSDENYESVIFRHSALKKLAAVFSFIGINSYSIYLWHLTILDLLHRVIHNQTLETIIFFAGAIAIGVLSTFLIEKKFLNLREKYFPKQES